MHKAKNKPDNIKAWQNCSLLEAYLQATSEKEHIKFLEFCRIFSLALFPLQGNKLAAKQPLPYFNFKVSQKAKRVKKKANPFLSDPKGEVLKWFNYIICLIVRNLPHSD